VLTPLQLQTAVVYPATLKVWERLDMRWFGSFILALVLAFLLVAAPAAAQRVALVIGNSAYEHTSKLTNPKNDATDVAAALRSHGFKVIDGFDLDKAAFDRKVRDFASALRGAQAGVFFFAGHGLQVAGTRAIPATLWCARTSSNSFALLMAITAWSANVVTRSACC
jgi:hypothetical protein